MPLKLSVEYFHASGTFEATLENGARFTFTRNDIGGKLENALTLYRRAVVSLLEDKPLRKTDKQKERSDLMELSAGKNVNVIEARGKKNRGRISLDDLDLDGEL